MPLYSYHPPAQRSSKMMYSLYKATNEQLVGSGEWRTTSHRTARKAGHVTRAGCRTWTLEFPGPDACFWTRNVCFPITRLIPQRHKQLTCASKDQWDYQVPAAHSDGSSRVEAWAACAGLLASCPRVLFHSFTGPHHSAPDCGSGCGLEGQWQGLQKMAVTHMQCGKCMDKEHLQDRLRLCWSSLAENSYWHELDLLGCMQPMSWFTIHNYYLIPSGRVRCVLLLSVAALGTVWINSGMCTLCVTLCLLWPSQILSC